MELGACGTRRLGVVELSGLVEIVKDNGARGRGPVCVSGETAHAQRRDGKPSLHFRARESGALGCLERLAPHGLERTPLSAQGGCGAAIRVGRCRKVPAQQMRLTPCRLEPWVGGCSGQDLARAEDFRGQIARFVGHAGPRAHRGRIDAEVVGLRAVGLVAAGSKLGLRLPVSRQVNVAGGTKMPVRFLGIFGAQAPCFGQTPAQSVQIALDPLVGADFGQFGLRAFERARFHERKDGDVPQPVLERCGQLSFACQRARGRVEREERPPRVRASFRQRQQQFGMRPPEILRVSPPEQIGILEAEMLLVAETRRDRCGFACVVRPGLGAGDAVAVRIEVFQCRDGRGTVVFLLDLGQRRVRDQVRRGAELVVALRSVSPTFLEALGGPTVVDFFGQGLDERPQEIRKLGR